jgi:hypothetical protein
MLDLPRMNNDLEQVVGSHRYHEQRFSGRRATCAETVIRGSMRLLSSPATRLQRAAADVLVPAYYPGK